MVWLFKGNYLYVNVLTQLNMTLDNDTVGTKWAGLKALCLTDQLCMILMYESTWSDCCIMMYNDDRSHITLDPGHSHVYLDGKVQHQHTNTSSVVSVYCISWTLTHMHNISIVSHSISVSVFTSPVPLWPDHPCVTARHRQTPGYFDLKSISCDLSPDWSVL